MIGSDILWLVPLGARVAHGSIPHSLPYATAVTNGWHDVPAGAELVLWSLFKGFGGDRGLVIAQAAAATVAVAALAAGLRREASEGGVLLVVPIVLAGSLPTAVVANASLFSLMLLPVLVLLLEAETVRPSRRVWLAVPLLAIWANLHGEVIVGWALLVCYLAFERGRRAPFLSIGLLLAATVAIGLNPALWNTPGYYRAVLDSEVARRGTDLWAPLGTGAFDVLLLAAAVALLGLLAIGGARVRLWEAIALGGLAVESVHVARTGVWFLFLAAYPAARGLRLRGPRRRVLVAAGVVLAAGAGVLLARGPVDPGSRPLALVAARTGEPVLADPVLGQQVVLAGGRVWVDNPLDAFRRSDQGLYLDWLAGSKGGASAIWHAGYVLVHVGSASADRARSDPRLTRAAATSSAVLYRVRTPRLGRRSG